MIFALQNLPAAFAVRTINDKDLLRFHFDFRILSSLGHSIDERAAVTVPWPCVNMTISMSTLLLPTPELPFPLSFNTFLYFSLRGRSHSFDCIGGGMLSMGPNMRRGCRMPGCAGSEFRGFVLHVSSSSMGLKRQPARVWDR